MKNIIKKINARQSIAASFFLTLTLAFGFGIIEPAITRAVEDQFTITQVITSEISFITPTSDVTMGSIAGLTGGVSYGSTTVRIFTNDSAGFTATVKASGSPAMQGNTQAGTIADYTPAIAGVPDYAYSVPTGEEFGFTVSASTTSHLAQKFLDNGSNTCNTGSADTNTSATCWMGLSTTATSTLVTNTFTAASGSTSTMIFRTTVNSGSSLPEDTYTATTTITATTN